MTSTVVMVSLDRDLLDALLADDSMRVAGIFDRAGAAAAWTVPVLGDDEAWPAWSAAQPPDVRTIHCMDVPERRRALVVHYGGLARARRWISPRASVSPRAQLGHGTLVQQGVYISGDVTIGDCVKINVGAAVHHDCRVGDYATLAPGARLLGTVTVGAGAYVGAGAVVLPRRQVGAGARVGAGAVITRDVAAGETVVGVPARPL